MGGGCYRIPGRELIFIGGHCPNACFPNHGGCEGSSEFEAVKTDVHCEIKPENQAMMTKTAEEIKLFIDKSVKQCKTIFLYVPDAFNEFYYEKFFKVLAARTDMAYIVLNAGVRTLVDRLKGGLSWKDIHDKGIREIWLGVESAELRLRNEYAKPSFTNTEVLEITQGGQAVEINMCWFLVDNQNDTFETKAKTLELIKIGNPYRVHIGDVRKYEMQQILKE